MQIIHDLSQIKISACVASIGNFDGVHLGHQAIIQQVRQLAEDKACLSTLILFEPQPLEFFQGLAAPARITNLDEKIFCLKNLGLDRLIVLNFNQDLKSLSAEDFIQDLLNEKLNVQHLIVGDDFKFGADRRGDLALLKKQTAFTVDDTKTVNYDQQRVSSSRVRAALAVSDFNLVAALLGRRYAMQGRVILGAQQGHKLGFPTANIDPQRLALPLSGVFAVRIHGLNQLYEGVANLGIRPTVDGTKALLETHIFNFDQDIYDREIQIEFVEKIREEQKFPSLDALRAQIAMDFQQARNCLKKGNS